MFAEGFFLFSTGTTRDISAAFAERKRTLSRRLVNHLDSELYALLISRASRAIALIGAHISFHRIPSRRSLLLLRSVFVIVPSREPREISSSTILFLFFLFLPLPPTRRKTPRDWIKIAGAISRTHDIGENATEALIMADTRRAVAATTFYPLTQDSHYTNVPPIIGPQSAALLLPREPLPALLNHFNQNHANRRGNQIPQPRRSDTAKISVKRSSSYLVSIL